MLGWIGLDRVVGLDWVAVLDRVGLYRVGLDRVAAIIIWLCKKNNNITYIYNKQLQ